jgi:hypothetical protein
MTESNQLKVVACRIVMAIQWTPALRMALGEQPQLGVYRWLMVAKGIHGKTMDELVEMYLECALSV